jgi:FtsP/CotA-like multicopper oxidase with cupredoxin domain
MAMLRRSPLAVAAACLLVSVLPFAAGSCGDDTTNAPAEQPKKADLDNSAIELVRAVDENDDPGIFELTLTASQTAKAFAMSSETPVWAYNGTVPGPLVEVDVGDRLIVHFRNDLPEETTIHWHGVRLPATMDGSLAMQSPVPPGGTFEYEFVLKDAGLFWFHPHVRSDIQVQKGLYGTIVVRGEEPAYDRELVAVLDDVRLKKDGTIEEYLDDEAAALGREGDTLLVNGVVGGTVRAHPGETLRLRLVNVANGRFFNVSLGGRTMRVVGTDGGLVPRPFDVTSLLMSPGERVDLFVVLNGAAGDQIRLTSEPYDRGHDSGDGPPLDLATITLEGDAVEGKPLPDAGPPLDLLPEDAEPVPLVLDEEFREGEITFTINGAAFPDVPMIGVPLGGVRRLEIRNDAEMDHPFHLHGFFFQEVERDGVPIPPDARVQKDTIIVPQESSMALLARFDEPGMWMYHCHILEHQELGMMGEIHVE